MILLLLKEIGYHLYEIVSSGLSHYTRVSKFLINYLLPNDYEMKDKEIVNDFNFGFTEFNWGSTKEESSVTISIRDLEEKNRASITLNYKDLEYNTNYIEDTQCEIELTRRFKTLNGYFEYYTENINESWIIIVYLFLIFFITTMILFGMNVAYKLFKYLCSVLTKKKIVADDNKDINSKKKVE